MVDPGVEFKTVERDPLSTNRDLSDVRPNLDVETVTVHAEVARCIAEAEEPRSDAVRFFWVTDHLEREFNVRDKLPSQLLVRARVRG